MTQNPITLGDLERNPALLNRFIAENTRSMIQYCVRNFRGINEQDAEELVQNAFLRLWEIVTKEGVKKKDTPAIAWMKRELKQRCIDLLRQSKREIFVDEGEDIINILSDPTSIEDEILRREIHQALRECIQQFRGRRREIFELYLRGYIAAEIARELDVAPAFISRETKIGCRLLRRCLSQRGFNEWLTF